MENKERMTDTIKIDDVLKVIDEFEGLILTEKTIEMLKSKIIRLSEQTKPDRVKSDNSRSNVVDEQRETTIRRDKSVQIGDNTKLKEGYTINNYELKYVDDELRYENELKKLKEARA